MKTSRDAALIRRSIRESASMMTSAAKATRNAEIVDRGRADMSEKIELLPCPFCGSEAKVLTARVSEDCEEARVECTSCAAAGPADEDAYANHAAAASYWNRRATLPPLWAREEILKTIRLETRCRNSLYLGSECSAENCQCEVAADAVLALSRTAGQEWRAETEELVEEWQPINTADPDKYLWLYIPAEKLSTLPGQQDEILYARPRDYCWATKWMTARVPAPPVAEPSS